MTLFGEDRKEFHQLSPIEKRINFDDFTSELIRLLTEFEPQRFPNDSGILAYDLLFSPAARMEILPNADQLPWPAAPVQYAANASNAAIKIFEAESGRLEALKGAQIMLKNILTVQCREEVQHLKDTRTGYINVTAQELFLAASKTHGQLTPVDHEAMRQKTLKPFNRSESLAVNLGRLAQAHLGMARIGSAVSDSDRLRELTGLLRAYHTEVAAIVDDYDKETDIRNRAWAPLVDFVQLRELRLRVPLIGGNRGQLHAVSEEESALDDAPSAAAAHSDKISTGGGNISISRERLKELEEAEKLVKAAPAPKYCFSCGWGSHEGLRCRRMLAKDGTLKDDFTKKQAEAKKPGTVDGKAGSTKLCAGFRKPN
jgi:hypothetical protein